MYNIWVLAIVTVLYIACLGILLKVARHNRARYALAKGVLSSLFVLVGVLSYLLGTKLSTIKFLILFAALVLCATGDVLLGIANKTKTLSKKPFAIGGLSFTLAHALFCTLFFYSSAFHWASMILPVVLIVQMIVQEAAKHVRLKKIRPLAYIYSAMVGFMVGNAIVMCVQMPLPGLQKVFLLVGSVLFLVSDLILLFLYFGVKKHKNLRPANLITYYVGIYLLALTAFWY